MGYQECVAAWLRTELEGSPLAKRDITVGTNGGIHTKVPVVYDEFFTKGAAKHKLYVDYSKVNYNDFTDKYMYLPFPLDCRLANHFKNVLGWESLNGTAE